MAARRGGGAQRANGAPRGGRRARAGPRARPSPAYLCPLSAACIECVLPYPYNVLQPPPAARGALSRRVSRGSASVGHAMAVPAVLLVGPTGAGKTPYGEHVERHGWTAGGTRGRQPAVHFDFGEQLREAVATGAASDRAGALSAAQIGRVRRVLEEGSLLEDGDVDIVRGILQEFTQKHGLQAGGDTVLLLNGMPRHSGQAKQIADLVSVDAVVSLDCSDATARARIVSNSGGDRAERVDDDAALVSKKLETFRRRTRPLLEYYAAHGARVAEVVVEVDSQPPDIQRMVEATLNTRRELPPTHAPTLSDAELQQFQRDGYLRLGKVGSSQHVEALQNRIDAIMLGEVTVPNMMMQLCPSATDLPQFAEFGAQQSRVFKGPTLKYLLRIQQFIYIIAIICVYI